MQDNAFSLESSSRPHRFLHINILHISFLQIFIMLSVGFLLITSLTLNEAQANEDEAKEDKTTQESKTNEKTDDAKTRTLFDGKTLGDWEVTKFGGQGEVKVKDGQIILEIGNDITGITYTKKVPQINYEITLEAMRIEGGDFFCGLTFPVEDSPCSFIVGGWGGATVGLSSIDDQDASENETTKYATFKTNQWYKIRLRVTKTKIQAFIDEKAYVNVETKGKKFTIRPEVELSTPLGICSFQTRAALKNIQIRELPEDEKK